MFADIVAYTFIVLIGGSPLWVALGAVWALGYFDHKGEF